MSRWILLRSEFFEQAYFRHAAESPYAQDIMLQLQDGLQSDPYRMAIFTSPCVPAPLWIYVSPPIGPHPLIRVAYLIEPPDRFVKLCSYSWRQR